MAPASRNEKDYLEITGTCAGFAIVAQKQHADELAALLAQRGGPCRSRSDTGFIGSRACPG